jgi:hypothetical protein
VKDYVIIRNPIKSTEELAEILGMSSARVEAIRKIMNTPVRRKKPSLAGKGTASRKKASQTAKRSAAKK